MRMTSNGLLMPGAPGWRFVAVCLSMSKVEWQGFLPLDGSAVSS